jgi:hypothetical protein
MPNTSPVPTTFEPVVALLLRFSPSAYTACSVRPPKVGER